MLNPQLEHHLSLVESDAIYPDEGASGNKEENGRPMFVSHSPALVDVVIVAVISVFSTFFQWREFHILPILSGIIGTSLLVVTAKALFKRYCELRDQMVSTKVTECRHRISRLLGEMNAPPLNIPEISVQTVDLRVLDRVEELLASHVEYATAVDEALLILKTTTSIHLGLGISARGAVERRERSLLMRGGRSSLPSLRSHVSDGLRRQCNHLSTIMACDSEVYAPDEVVTLSSLRAQKHDYLEILSDAAHHLTSRCNEHTLAEAISAVVAIQESTTHIKSLLNGHSSSGTVPETKASVMLARVDALRGLLFSVNDDSSEGVAEGGWQHVNGIVAELQCMLDEQLGDSRDQHSDSEEPRPSSDGLSIPPERETYDALPDILAPSATPVSLSRDQDPNKVLVFTGRGSLRTQRRIGGAADPLTSPETKPSLPVVDQFSQQQLLQELQAHLNSMPAFEEVDVACLGESSEPNIDNEEVPSSQNLSCPITVNSKASLPVLSQLKEQLTLFEQHRDEDCYFEASPASLSSDP